MSDKVYTVKLLPKAREDLEGIYRYITEDLCNAPAMLHLADKFEEAFERIAAFPNSCAVCSPEPTYRKLIVDNYIAFYRVYEDISTVIIFRVLYGMMDYEKYL
jgi:plasmid stabilization system protein ParE